MKTVERNLKDDIVKTKGKFFHVTWYKKNGDLRSAVAQTNVKKGLKGVGRLWDDADNQITCYEKSTGKRIVITTDRIVEFSCGATRISA